MTEERFLEWLNKVGERFLAENSEQSCLACGSPVVSAGEDSQATVGLYVKVEGWFGGFIDSPGVQGYLCRRCATGFARAVPEWLRDRMGLVACGRCAEVRENCSGVASRLCVECEDQRGV